MPDDQHDATQPPPSSLSVARSIDGVPPWGRVLLARVWRGINIDTARAMSGSKVSRYLIRHLATRCPHWGDMLTEAEAGTLADCPVLPDDLTRAFALEEEQRRHDLAMEADAKYAAPYLRLGMEALGRVGRPAMINNVVQVGVESAGQHSARLYQEYMTRRATETETHIVEGQVAGSDDTAPSAPQEE